MIKLIRQFSFVVIFLALNGCMARPQVIMLRESLPPKQKTDKIDVFYTKPPNRPYEEIAKIQVGDTDDEWNIKQIKLKAREIGANGVIIIGRVGTYGYGTAISKTAIVGAGEGYGLVAIAIIYK